MTIIHEGKNYDLNIDKALSTGALKQIKVKRPLVAKDIPNGTPIKYNLRSAYFYVMLDNTSNTNGQVLEVRKKPSKRFFNFPDNCIYMWDFETKKWVNYIEE